MNPLSRWILERVVESRPFPRPFFGQGNLGQLILSQKQVQEIAHELDYSIDTIITRCNKLGVWVLE